MNFKQASLLTGLALTGLVGSSGFSPAQAVQLYTYTFSGGTLSDGGTLAGSFTFDLSAPTLFTSYTTWNITTSNVNPFPSFTYTNSNSEAIADITGLGSTNANETVSFNVTGLPGSDQRTLTLAFGTRPTPPTNTPATFTALSTSDGTIMRSFGNQWNRPSQEFLATGGQSFNRGLTSTITATATPVPFESNALPVVGASVLFGAGVWAKSKLKSQSKFAQKLLTK